ncbi:condensation domain-containing protein [Rhodococcus sp. IEGM 1379]|uniref:condensation domain-containing protein n=1 Tax=Rhodococcus sp. IEGM 1379 TaxID=3047086 RepID=UPI0024B6C3EC|nr:condensation domain-containing protein [Rhodococcus sp. IEGM 1379]MDI9918854.1 condensation domain-containing protein [Rhodococcus sp. IEGM 1379]
MKRSPGRRSGFGTPPDRQVPRSSELCALTPFQQTIFDSQQRRPEIALCVSHYVDVAGTLDLAILRASIAQSGREFGSDLTLQISNGVVVTRIGKDRLDRIDVIDLRGESDSETAAHNWMRSESVRPLDLLSDPLAGSAVLVIGEARWLWYTRIHQIVLDGAGARSMTARAAEVYTAMVRSTPVPLTSAESVHSMTDTEQGYRGSTRWDADRQYWDAKLAGAPARTSLAEPGVSTGAKPLVRSATVPPGVTASLVHLAESQNVTLSTVVTASFAMYLARMTGSDDVILRLPVPVRTTHTVRRSGGTMSNIVPLRLIVDPRVGVDELLRAVKFELVGALRHQKYRDQRLHYGPVLTLNLFPVVLTVGDAQGVLHCFSAGPVEDLEVAVSQVSRDGELRIGFAANPDVYTGESLTVHHRRFLDFLELFSATEPRTQLVDVDPRTGTVWGSAVRHSRNLAYWSTLLASPAPELGLLAAPVGERSSAEIMIDPELYRGLEALADSMCTSMFVLLQAAVAGLLRRMGSASEISIGISVRGYGATTADEFVSMFANQLVLRSAVDTNVSLARLIEQMDDVIVDALIHADIRLSAVMANVGDGRSVDAGPPFRVLVSAQDPIDAHPQFPEVMVGIPVGFDLAAMPEVYVALPIPQQNSDRFVQPIIGFFDCLASPQQVDGLAFRFVRVLRAMVDNSHTSLGSVDLLRPDERKELMAATQPNPVSGDLSERFVQVALENPDTIAVSSGADRITYAELFERSNRLAHKLIGMGVEAEALVGIRLAGSVNSVVAIIAVLEAGGAYFLLDGSGPALRQDFVLCDAQPHFVIADSEISGQIVVSTDAEGYSSERPHHADRRDANALAYIQYSGRSYGLSVTHGAAIASGSAGIWGALLHGRTLIPSNDFHYPGGFPPVRGHSVYVLDDHLSPVPIGVPGEIYVIDGHLPRGYLRRPGRTAVDFVADPFNRDGRRLYRTSERGRWTATGQLEYLEYGARTASVRGVRIELGEIDAVMTALRGIEDSITVVVPTPAGGAVITYVRSAQTGSSESVVDLDALAVHAMDHLPSYMVPDGYLIVDSFPTGVDGNIDIAALPSPILAPTPAIRRVSGSSQR